MPYYAGSRVVTYRTDPEALRAVIPAPLEMTQPIVKYEFIRMADSTGFGDLEVLSGVHIVSNLTLGLGTVVHDYLS